MKSTEKAKPHPPKNKVNKKSKGQYFTLFIAFLALFFTAIGIGAGYKNWLRIHDKTKDNKAKIELIQKDIQQLPTASSLTKLRQEVLQESEQNVKETANILTEIQQFQIRSRQYAETMKSQMIEITRVQGMLQKNSQPKINKDWLLAETDYLIQMANHRLYLAQDKKGALRALKAASTNLAELDSPHYLPVRQQLRRDIEKLQQFSPVHSEQLSQQISAFVLQLNPLKNSAKGQKINLTTNKKTPDTSLWHDVKNKTTQMVNDAIIIRKHDKTLQNTLNSDAKQYLYRLLKLRLETLRLMTLQKYDSQYHQQITLIKTTLNAYYPATTAKPLLEQLAKLDAKNLQPDLPNISQSLRQLTAARRTDFSRKKITVKKEVQEEENKQNKKDKKKDKKGEK